MDILLSFLTASGYCILLKLWQHEQTRKRAVIPPVSNKEVLVESSFYWCSNSLRQQLAVTHTWSWLPFDWESSHCLHICNWFCLFLLFLLQQRAWHCHGNLQIFILRLHFGPLLCFPQVLTGGAFPLCPAGLIAEIQECSRKPQLMWLDQRQQSLSIPEQLFHLLREIPMSSIIKTIQYFLS